MQDFSTAIEIPHRKSELFKKRVAYRLEQGFSEDQANRPAQLKGEIDLIRSKKALTKKGQSLPKRSAKALPEEGSLILSNEENQLEGKSEYPDLSPGAIAKEIAFQISKGTMTELPSIENSFAYSQTHSAQTFQEPSNQNSENSLFIENSQKPENLFNVGLYFILYLAATVVLVPTTAQALGGTWQAWVAAITIDISLGVVFSQIFETGKNLVRGLWSLLTVGMIFLSFSTLKVSASQNSTLTASDLIAENLEVQILQNRVQRLNESLKETPADQLTNRRRVNAELTEAENSLTATLKAFQSSNELSSLEDKTSAGLMARSALLILSMFYMYRIRRALRYPEIVAALRGGK